MRGEERADPECFETHLHGLAAIDCIDEGVARRTGWTPVQRCDNCCERWTDMEAAFAVAARRGVGVLSSERQLWVREISPK